VLARQGLDRLRIGVDDRFECAELGKIANEVAAPAAAANDSDARGLIVAGCTLSASRIDHGPGHCDAFMP
jgi:hypothetical protein